MNGNELLILYREHVTRVFGPPVEPISLTLDAFGKCLLSIPFRPVQRVPITKSKTGQLELAALGALFQMVAGNGYCFCPGIPDKFLVGRPCGRYVTLHRIPFKRFNATGCPVYFKIPKTEDFNNAKESQLPVRTLCPRCRQVAKWAQTLPISRNSAAVSQVVNPAAQNQNSQPVHEEIKTGSPLVNSNVAVKSESEFQDNKSSAVFPNTVVGEEVAAMGEDAIKGTIPLTVLDPPKTRHSRRNSNSNASPHPADTKKSSAGFDGNVSSSAKKRGMNNEKLKAVSESLRQLLRQRTMTKEGLSDAAAKHKDGTGQNKAGERSTGPHSPRSPRGEKVGKNVCRICNKQFSSNLRLSKHVQRHEGNIPYLSRVLRRKIPRQNASAIILSRLFRGSIVQSAFLPNGKRRNSAIPESSLQLMLKYFDSLLNERKYEKNGNDKKRKCVKRKMEEQIALPKVQSPPSRPGLSRSGSGLAGFETLLSAAQLAEIDDSKSISPGIVNNFPVHNGPANNSFSAEHGARDSESPSQAKQARQSLRLASKRANKKSKAARTDLEPDELSLQSESGTPSDEAIMMTNLDLLSTVSLQADMRDNRASPRHQLPSFAGNPDSKIQSALPNPKVSDDRLLIWPHAFSPEPRIFPAQKSDNASSGKRLVLQHQTPVTAVPQQNSNSSTNNTLCPLPSFILGPENILINQLPHSSSLPMIRLASATLKLPVLRTAPPQVNSMQKSLETTTSSANFPPPEEIQGSCCGAMDLSKPKPSPSADTGSSSPASQDSTDVLRHFMMINPAPVPPKPVVVVRAETLPPDPASLVSTKEADESLQARMFASAKNYKLDSSKQSMMGQVQAVIASQAPTSGTTKQSKGKEKAQPVSDKSEIQCGYKWSGSGGLVKERTQLVRELVPSVVMANILNGPVSNSGLPKMDDPISAPVQNITKLRGSQKQQDAQNLAKSPHRQAANQNPPSYGPVKSPVRPKTPQFVLNLSKNRNDQDVEQGLPSSSLLSNKPPPGPFPTSILKTSLLNSPSSLLLSSSISSQKQPVVSSVKTTTGSISKKSHSKTSVLAPPPNTVLTLPSPPTLSAAQTTPSIYAAILRNSPKHLPSTLATDSSNVGFSVSVSSAVVPIISDVVANNLEITEIKTEPLDIFTNSGQKSTLPTVIPVSHDTVIKTEKLTEDEVSSSTDRDLSTPPNLVMDMGVEKVMVLPTSSAKSNKKTTKSTRGKVTIVTNPPKCQYCSKLFATTRDHDGHVCPRKPRS